MQELQYAIEAVIPGAKVVAKVGRMTAYEVRVDGMLIHSKLEMGKFSDKNETVKIIKNVVQEGKPKKVTKISPTCTIL